MSIILAGARVQSEFRVNLDYKVGSRAARTTEYNSIFKKQNKTKNKRVTCQA